MLHMIINHFRKSPQVTGYDAIYGVDDYDVMFEELDAELDWLANEADRLADILRTASGFYFDYIETELEIICWQGFEIESDIQMLSEVA